MKTLLVLAKQPALSAALRAVLDASQYRVLTQSEVWEAEPLLLQGIIDACVLEAELTTIQPIREVEQIRRLVPHCPILIYAGAKQWEWEEEAYLMGVAHVLAKPVRGRLLNTLLERLWLRSEAATGAAGQRQAPRIMKVPESLQSPCQTLAVLRDFSGILSHSLCAGALLKQFLLQLREILGVNRAAIFLRSSPGAPGTSPASPPDRRLHAAYAIGIAPGLLEHFELSLEAGIGGYVFRQGRILKSEASEASGDREIQKEFELLGAQVAIPILDRESLVGVAVFDGRLTGEPFANEELSLVFLLLEQLGLAIKNIWLHDQLAAHNEMVVDILSQLGNGCVVVGRNLEMFHANRVAQALFARPEGGAGPLEFSDLPQALGSKIFEVLQTGQGVPPFKYRPAGDAETVYQLTITPFKRRNSNLPNAVLLLIEDVTQIERNQRLEIESANLRLVKTMAEHLAHEIGNALVPISTHQQLLAQRLDDLEFRASLSQVMASGVRRISRLVRQMLYLASDTIARNDSIPVKQLVEDAFAEAQASFPEKTACLRLEDGAESFLISGDRTALKHALSEILINSFQANPANPKALVRLQRRTNGVGTAWLCIEVEDAGPGFTPKAVRKAQEPFFSTRNVGLGLGLAVTRKILEAHQGKLETPLTPVGQHGIVRITLPLTSQPGGNP